MDANESPVRMIRTLKEFSTLLDTFHTELRADLLRFEQRRDSFLQMIDRSERSNRDANQLKHHAIQDLFAKRAYFDRMRPALLEAARTVSQWILHGRINDVEKVELQLRLARFEAVVGYVDQSLHNAMMFIQS